jgi:hypothetical protein
MCSNTNFALACLRLEPVIDVVVVIVSGGGNEVPTLQLRPLRGGGGDIMNGMVWWADGGLETSSNDVDVPTMKEQHAISRRDRTIFIVIEFFRCR